MKFQISLTRPFDGEDQQPYEGAEIVGTNEWGQPIWGIEINSLEELISLQENSGHPIIVFSEAFHDCDYSKREIEIYNGYRE